MILRKFFFSALFLLFAFSTSVRAQLCTGSLGDPIVKFTFGYDTLQFGLPPSPLDPGITNYTFAPNSCPPDGSYTITDNTSGCFGGTWYDLPEDHTPNDLYGYMMLVNATATPGEFYTQTVTGLCGGTTYEFAAWILNLNVPTACGGTPTKPNITFDILTTTGTLLKTYNTSNIGVTPFAIWKQFGTFFTTPATTTSVVIKMTNNAPGGCGNDIALDDITFRPCGATVTAVINGSSTSVNVCAGSVSSNTFTGTVSASGPTTAYQWQISTDTTNWTDIPGATGMTYVPTVTTQGHYQYRFTVADAPGTPSSCRTISNIIYFNVDISPGVPAFTAPDTTCISNQPVVFTEQPQNPPGSVVEWDWNFGDATTIVAPTNAPQSHTYSAPGSYNVTLQVKNATGCLSAAFNKMIVITGAPTVDFTYANTCENNPVNFTSITNAGANAAYAWTFGDTPATTSTDPNPVKTYTTGGIYNVSLTITSFGCSSTISKPVMLTAKPATPSFTAPATGCVNQVITFQPANNASVGITQWIWNFGDMSAVVTSATNIAQTHPYGVAGTYSVTLQVSANGCMSDSFQQSITITNPPTVDFSFNDTCAGFPITFSSSTNAGSGAQYAWTFGDMTVSTDANPVKTFTGSGTFNVSLSITSGGCSASISHPVTIIPILSAPVVTTDSISSDFLRFKWQPVTGAVAYKVSIDGGLTFTNPSSGTTGTTHSVGGLTPGQTVNIIVQAIGANACENSTGNGSGITKIADIDIYIPNTFLPESSIPANRTARVWGNNLKDAKFLIFNQWGQKIYEANSVNEAMHGWDGTYKGKSQPVGVYVYAGRFTLNSGKVIDKKGSINLVK